MFPQQPPYVPSEQPRTDFATTTESAGVHARQTVVSGQKLPPPADPDDEILEQARERFRRIVDTEAPWRAQATQELDFVDGLQHWDQAMRDERKGLPCLTFDRIGPSVEQVVNNAMQNPPEPRISPVGNGADKWTADMLQGLLRNIENDSRAEIAYHTGFEHAVKIGRGWWRVHFEFEDDGDIASDDPRLFYQKIVIKRLANPFQVYPDPAATEFDLSDMRYCFVTEDLDKDVFKDLYPRSQVANLDDFTSIGDKVKQQWFPDGSVRVAEYWWVETSREKVFQLDDGSLLGRSVRQADLTPELKRLPVLNWRWATHRTVCGCKINGIEVLEKWTWPGKWIPLIPCIGKEIIKEGRRGLRGMIRPAMDANLSYDYMRSKQAQAVGLAPVSTWLVAKGQLNGVEYKWTDANRKAYAYLEYELLTGPDGELAPPPQRIQAEPNTGDITAAIANAADDLRATLSSYRPDIGEPTPDQSGKAVLAIQRQGDNAHFHFHGHLAWSLVHTARVIIDLAPHVYSEERLLTIYDPDGSTRDLYINSEDRQKWAKGQDRIYRLTKAARYDVTIGTGPTYAAKRDQQKDAMLQLAPSMPVLVARAPDKILEYFDFPKDIVDRVRPPDVVQQQDGETPLPPQAQAMISQQSQLVQQLTQRVNELTEDLKTQRLKLESTERVNLRHDLKDLAVADLKTGSDQAIQTMQQRFSVLEGMLDRMMTLMQPQGGPANPAPAAGNGPANPNPAPAPAQPEPQAA